MKKRQQTTQLILISVGFFLILATYFLYPTIIKKQSEKKVDENITIEEKILKEDKMEEDKKIASDNDKINKFESVEYKGLYNLDPFEVKSDDAYILAEKPDIVYMKNMLVNLYLNDGRIVTIKSDEGTYNKVTYDCLFEKNVRATDGGTKIFAENLDLLATENSVQIYNNVNLIHTTGSLLADKIDYDFDKKFFKVSMFDQEKIKMKIIE
tara:strand:- start:5419 stop:6048 length:630 start_codon:yes stop_codon:yes gene_type:complete